jgi:hypothetical protein
LCIKNNYIYSAKILIKNNINLVSSLYWCIDNKNYIIASYIITKINNCDYNSEDVVKYLFDKITDELVLLKFIDRLIVYIINKTAENITSNYYLIYKVIDSNIIQYHNKIVFINKIKHLINPFEQEPFILYTITNNNEKGMYEITYLLLKQLFIDNKIKLRSVNNNEKVIDIKSIIGTDINNYYYYDKNINFNIIPIILKYIKQNYIHIDCSLYTEFNIYSNEIYMYNLMIIIIYFCVFLTYHLYCNKVIIKNTNIKAITNDIVQKIDTNNEVKKDTIKEVKRDMGNDVRRDMGNEVKKDMGNEVKRNMGNDVKRNMGNEVKKDMGNEVKRDISNKNVFNSIKGAMYIEIDDYETNKALLETETDYKSKIETDYKSKIETDYKSKIETKTKSKHINTIIDSKTILFTENTNISSDIEDNDIYTFD